jgi:hypothetical protein
MTETEIVRTSRARRIGAQLAVGGVVGFAGWSFAGPAVIAWWYEPPVKDAFSCASSVQAAVQQFVIAQFVCAAIGGMIALLAVFFFRRALGDRSAA